MSAARRVGAYRRGAKLATSGLVALALIVTLAPRGAFAQTPAALYSFQAPLVIDNTDQGDAFTCFERPRETRRLIWNQTEYMVLDASTDVMIYNPQNAQIIDKGHFGLGFGCGGVLSTPTINVPDAILGLDGINNITVCDECRWGVMNSDKGAVIWDFGNPAAGGSPVVDNPNLYTLTLTGGTYRIGSQQYVLLGGGYGSPFYNKCPGDQMGVYTISANGAPSSNPIQCVSDSADFDPRAGQEVWVPFNGTPQPFYVYKQASNSGVNVVRIGSDGIPVLPPQNAVPFSSGNLDYFSLDTRALSDASDPHFWLLITNQSQSPAAHVYKVTPSAAAVALDFQEVANFSAASWDRGDIHYPYVFLMTPGGLYGTVGFYDLSTNPPTLLDDAYWNDPNSDFNTAAYDPTGAENSDAFFTSDGGWLYFPRYYQMARFKYTPSNPTAAAAVSPSPAFWGDTVTVDGSGSGGAAEYALWIDNDPTGTAQTTPVAGLRPGQSGAWGSATSLNWTVPDNPTPPYYGHVAVRDVGRGYPYDPASHPEMLDTKQVTLDLTPTAHITAPDTVFIDEHGTLSAGSSDGNPTGYSWTITSPTNQVYRAITRDVSQLFNESGSWTVDLTIDWKNGEYSDTATPATVAVKSALASFTISPTPQYNNVPINLDGSASKPAGGLTYQWSVLNYNQQEVWSKSGETATATIPADTLTPGNYTVKLTVRNTSTQEIDIATQGMAVGDGSAGISITPTNPERGQQVTFQTSGIDGITAITWHFGGPSCDGSPADWTCTAWCSYPTTYTYSTANTYNVSAVVTSSSGTRTLNGTVTVQPTGQCTTTGCSYTASASPTSFSASGGTGMLSVGASSTSCAWTAASSASWLVLSRTSGSGSTSVSFSVGANSGSSRAATITVTGAGATPRTVSVSQAAAGGDAGTLTISPASPNRGQMVTFSLVGINGIQGITWHFGGASCDGSPQDQDCSGIYCSPTTYTYSTAGTYNVSAVVHTSSGAVTKTGTVSVQPSGECSGGACSYTLSASATSFAVAGGSGTVTVQADSGCAWTATSNASWLHITGASSGSGNGSFGFGVDANSDGAARSAQLKAGGKSVTISQTTVATGAAVVPAAARTIGQQGTNWQTDLWIFNPNSNQVTVNVRFYPDNADNSDVPNQPPLVQKLLPGLGTVFLPDVLSAVVPTGNLKGALGIDVSGSISRPLVISSRTFNTDANGGTFGQFVPVVQGSPATVSELLLTGLREDADFRTNIGLVSGSADAIGGIVIHVLDQNGTEVGSYGLGLNPHGMTQIDNIVDKLNPPVSGDLTIFSVKINFVDWRGDPVAQPVTAYASVIDNHSGDAIFIPAMTQ